MTNKLTDLYEDAMPVRSEITMGKELTIICYKKLPPTLDPGAL